MPSTAAPLAIDIAVLLPSPVQDRVRRLNASFDASDGRGFRFDNQHLPHLTIGQHYVRPESLPAVRHHIGRLVSDMVPFEVLITGSLASRTAQLLKVERSAELYLFHTQVMNAMQPFEATGGRADSFQYDGWPPRPADITWVSTFRQISSYTSYSPHITLAIGTAPLTLEPFGFTICEIAILRLGRFCTCREKLATWTLGGRDGNTSNARLGR